MVQRVLVKKNKLETEFKYKLDIGFPNALGVQCPTQHSSF